MPSWELFEKQSDNYKELVFPKNCQKRLVVEAGTSFGWERYIGINGVTICKDDFGASAPYKKLLNEFGFTVENIISESKKPLG